MGSGKGRLMWRRWGFGGRGFCFGYVKHDYNRWEEIRWRIISITKPTLHMWMSHGFNGEGDSYADIYPTGF